MNKKKVQNRLTKSDTVTQEIPMACADEKAAVEFLESKRWGDSPTCPLCGCDNVYQMQNAKTGERQENYRWRCHDCNGQYTVRKGTVFEDSRISLRHWCYGFWRASTSKKGVSALEIHRHTGVSYKSCLFMLNRIRFAMSDSSPAPLKGDVEIDETYIGGKPRFKGKHHKREKWSSKLPVLAMIERNGNVKTRPITSVTGKTLREAIRSSVDKKSAIITDELRAYRGIGQYFNGKHHTVCHSKGEYVKRGTDIHTNTVEAFFSVVKRGLNGIYHSVSKEYLPLYLNEFEFRHNHRDLEDGERIVAAIKGSEGKRLMYKEPLKA